ncbi:MAG: hypothetical protein WC080_00225 [Patescibacteria group bacterium]|jgi:hypothetical protein
MEEKHRIRVYFPERTFPTQTEVDVEDPTNREEVLRAVAAMFALDSDDAVRNTPERARQWCPSMCWDFNGEHYTLKDQPPKAHPQEVFADKYVCGLCHGIHENGKPCPYIA